MSWFLIGLILGIIVLFVLFLIFLSLKEEILKWTEENKFGYIIRHEYSYRYDKVTQYKDFRLPYFLISAGIIFILCISMWPLILTLLFTGIVLLTIKNNSTLNRITTVLREDFWEDEKK